MRPEIKALLEKAHRRLDGAVRDLDAGDAEGAASRIYYAAFHAASAALASEGLTANLQAADKLIDDVRQFIAQVEPLIT